MNMSKAIQEMHEVFADSFMQPQAYKGSDIEEALIESGLDVEADSYYCRLSADGYLDCTDWDGPFASLDECAEYLVSVYGE